MIAAVRPRVLYYDMLRYQPQNLELLARGCDVVTLPNPAHDTADTLADVDAFFAPIGYYVDGAKMDRAPRLKAIASNTTGNSHIDVAAAERRGVRVVCLKDEQAFLATVTPTVELAWGLLLSVVRRIPWAFDAVKQGEWNRRNFGGNAMLSRMSLGVVGLGRLGGMMARQALAFGMTVRFCDREPKEAPPGIERCDSLEAVVAASDVVSVHIPHEPANVRLFDARLFAAFKDGAYFINTSRGELVDTPALIGALSSGKLAGAGLDVLEGEFDPAFPGHVGHHPLVEYARQHANLVITPHIGGSTRDAWSLTERRTIERLLEVLRPGAAEASSAETSTTVAT